MVNLLSNAIKFTEAGGHVDLSVRGLEGNIEIEVRDNGIGMAPEFLPHAFDRFRQADESTTRKHGGLGLGLAIVRDLTTARWRSAGHERGRQGIGVLFRCRQSM